MASRAATRDSNVSRDGFPNMRSGLAGLLAPVKSAASGKVLHAASAASKSSNLFPASESMNKNPDLVEVPKSPYTDVILQHIQTLVTADQDDDDEDSHGDPEDSARNLREEKSLPSVRLRISLLHSSSMNSGVKIVSNEQETTSSPSWDNLGEVYFRGTLRDLDATYLEVGELATLSPSGHID